MPITKQKQLFYFVNGVPFESLESAQRADLRQLIPKAWAVTDVNMPDLVADWMLKNSEAIVATLTTTPKSRIRKPRKDKGVARKKTVPVPELIPA